MSPLTLDDIIKASGLSQDEVLVEFVLFLWLRDQLSPNQTSELLGIPRSQLKELRGESSMFGNGIWGESNFFEQFKSFASSKQPDFFALLECLNPTTEPPTLDEKKRAEDIISRGIARAQNAPSQSPEEIWERFNVIRQRIADNHHASQ